MTQNKSATEILEELKWYVSKRHLFTMSLDFQMNDAELIIDGGLPTDSICALILEKAKTL